MRYKKDLKITTAPPSQGSKTNAEPISIIGKFVASAWTPFIKKLLEVLDDLEQGQLLTLQVKSSREWVQFATQDGTVRIECKSNHFRPEGSPLTVRQVATLAAIGWSAPSGTAEQSTPENDLYGSPNFYVDLLQPIKVKKLTAFVARTFAEVFSAKCPDELVYEAFDGEGDSLPLPQLGLKPLLADVEESANPMLPTRILETIAELTGIQDLDWDSDGDAGPIRIGTIKAYARVVEGGQYVRFYCPVAHEVEATQELLVKMNELNCVYGHVHVCHLNGAITVISDVLVNPFNVNYVASGLGYFLQVADAFSIELVAELGSKSTSTQQRLWH